MRTDTASSVARRAGILALIAVSLFVVLVRPITRPTGPLARPQGFTRWSLLAEAGADDRAPLTPPVGESVVVFVVALAGVLPRLLERTQPSIPSLPFRRRKIPAPRACDSSSH